MTTRRLPWLAALLSAVSPGLGHLYVGRVRSAIAWGLAALLAPPIIMLLVLDHLSGPLAIVLFGALPVAAIIAPAILAWRLAKASTPFEPRAFNRWYYYLAFWACAGVIGQVGVLPSIRKHYQAFRIPSGAMIPTLEIGDFLFVRRIPANYAPSSDQIVVFSSPEEPGLSMIKRVVGVSGDTVAMQAGMLYRNGVSVSEPYVQHENPTKKETSEYRERMRQWQGRYLVGATVETYQPDISDWGPLVVPPDSLFLLGDNRDLSYDSRYYGWVGRDRLIGEPRLIYYSYDPFSPRLLPALTATRWSRIGYSFLSQ